MPRQRACDRQRARSVLWPLWPPGKIGWERPCCRLRIQEKRPERKRPLRGFTFFTKVNAWKYCLALERAQCRATQHSLEILRPRISRSTPPRLSNETSQRTARVARYWARKLLPQTPVQLYLTRRRLHPRTKEDEGILAFWELSKVTVLQEGASGAKKCETAGPKYRPKTLILVWLHFTRLARPVVGPLFVLPERAATLRSGG